jgi:hypothetical protein
MSYDLPMKKIAILALITALALPLSAATWKSVSLMDADCAGSKSDKADTHTRSCALKCADSGFGVVVDNKFVPLDAKGNELAKAALEKSDKKDHLRVTVEGELKDGVIQVSSLSLD